MREIKFRYIIEIEGKTYSIVLGIHKLKSLHIYGGNSFIDMVKKTLMEKYPELTIYEVSSYKLLSEDLFTGLLDKNRKEIYEGDIIEVDWKDKRYKKTKFEVKWNQWNCCFEFQGGSPEADAENYFEVIGNITENKELLK